MQAQRLFDTLEELSTCNATPGNGVTRFSWSEADSRARRVLERELKAIGQVPHAVGPRFQPDSLQFALKHAAGTAVRLRP